MELKGALLGFLEKVYGEGEVSEQLLEDFARETNFREYTIGHNLELSENDAYYVLIGGRIRVLQRSWSGSPQSICALKTGHLWFSGDLNPRLYQLLSSSENTLIGEISPEYFESNPKLRDLFAQTRQELGQYLKSLPEDKQASSPKAQISQQPETKLTSDPPSSLDISRDHKPYSLPWYIQLYRQNWVLSGLMIFSSVMVQVFALGTPIFYMVVFDRVFGRQNLYTLDVMALGIILLMVFDFAIKQIRSWILSYQLTLIDRITLQQLVHNIFRLPFSKINSESIRAFTERFNELAKTNQALISTILISSLDVIFSLIVAVVLMLINLPLALISLTPLIPIAVINFMVTPALKKDALQVSLEQRKYQLKLTEIMQSAEIVKSLESDRNLRQSLLERCENAIKKSFSFRIDKENVGIWQGLMINIGTIITLYYGAHAVLEGHISYGEYMAINMISRNVLSTFQRFMASLLDYQEALVALDNFQKLEAEPYEDLTIPTVNPEKGIILDRLTGLVSAENLSFRYRADAPLAIANLNFQIEPGQKVVLTGKSGAGKTTLIRLIQRLYPPSEGYLLLDNFNLADYDEINLKRHLGVVAQRPILFEGSLRDNLRLANPDATMREIAEVVSLVGLDEVILKLPQGYDYAISSLGSNLAGGIAARISLARMLLTYPSMLVIDEVLNLLDKPAQTEIYRRLLEKYRLNTCLFVSDFRPLHEIADLILVLQDGKLVERGDFKSLQKQGSYYQHLFAFERSGQR
ncbi:MAG: ATP-binding cassette domain-containing protein [Candidatus Caenarcaniphilales bacterium]|nr:ATP-binding cassette domain-containing protein [Candidatus Caenarcaniphilales bacterium]